MKRTLVTGVAGFTGRYLAPVLADRGSEVHGIVHSDDPHDVPGVAHVHKADLADGAALKRVVREVRPDHVVHLGAISFAAHDDIRQMYETNIVGSRQLLEALTEVSPRPSSVLLASTASVYGNAREEVLDETIVPAPANDYGVTKLAMEYVASIYAARLPLIIVRPFNYTGRGQRPQFLIPKIVNHARQRQFEIELGNLDVARDFSDVRSIVDAYARLLDAPRAIGETFNICSGRAVRLRDIIALVSKYSGHVFNVKVNPKFVRSNEVRTLRGSAKKLEGVIGALNVIPLERTLQWMLEN